MLCLMDDQRSLWEWESVLRPELFRLNEELTEVDRLLDDERFFAPFKARFDTRLGRPTIPVATYLRLMYLKRRYRLGYETLVKRSARQLCLETILPHLA
jgi:IS5 family transposase